MATGASRSAIFTALAPATLASGTLTSVRPSVINTGLRRGAENFVNIVPEAAVSTIAISVSLLNRQYLTNYPDALCVSGLTADAYRQRAVKRVKETVLDTWLQHGRLPENEEQSQHADGCVTATTLKRFVFCQFR